MVNSGVIPESLRNPCQDSMFPMALGFTYFFYLQDSNKAYRYYKIASMHDDVPPRIPLFAKMLLHKK